MAAAEGGRHPLWRRREAKGQKAGDLQGEAGELQMGAWRLVNYKEFLKVQLRSNLVTTQLRSNFVGSCM